jgi:hypothetical protein
MAKTKTKSNATELDLNYLLKMIVYLVLGSFWLRIQTKTSQIPVPVGFIIGLALARQEKLQIDRKLEYAILLMAMFIGFWLPIGLGVSL